MLNSAFQSISISIQFNLYSPIYKISLRRLYNSLFDYVKVESKFITTSHSFYSDMQDFLFHLGDLYFISGGCAPLTF